MPTPTKGSRLGSGPAHQRLLLANLATALFQHGRITTTEAKAKRLRPVAERLITFAKRGDLHARRQALTVVRDKSVIHTLFSEIGPSYGTRHGGYTRITKVGPRKGDNAPMAVIELVEAAPTPEGTDEGSRRRGTRRTARAGRQVAATERDDEPQSVQSEAEPGEETDERGGDTTTDTADEAEADTTEDDKKDT